MHSSSSAWLAVVIELSAVVLLTFVTSILEFTTYINPPELGIWCHDIDVHAPFLPETVDTLKLITVTFMYPMTGDSLSTDELWGILRRRLDVQSETPLRIEMIFDNAAYFCGSVNFICREEFYKDGIIIFECMCHYFYWWRTCPADREGDVWHVSLSHPWQPFKQLLLKLFNFAGFYYIGFVCTMLLTDCIKLSVGRLRPNFLDVCDMNWHETACNTSSIVPKYIAPPLPCANPSVKELRQARLSFPSGHASMSTYWAIATLVYMEYRVCGLYARNTYHLIHNILVVYVASAISFSRVTDYHHRWTDVMAGMTIGCIVSALVFKFAHAFYIRHLVRSEHDERNTKPDLSRVHWTQQHDGVEMKIKSSPTTNGHCHLDLHHSASQVPFVNSEDQEDDINTYLDVKF